MQSMRARAGADPISVSKSSVPQSIVNWNSARLDNTRLASAFEN
jgi:hypothetical protein